MKFKNLEDLQQYLLGHAGAIGVEFKLQLSDRIVTCRLERTEGLPEGEEVVEEEEDTE